MARLVKPEPIELGGQAVERERSNVDLLAAVPILRGLGRIELEGLAKLVRRVRYERSETILRRGEQGDTLLIVLSGEVRVVSSARNGNEVILNIIEPGAVVGEIAVLDGGSRTADVVAADRTEALVLKRILLLSFLQEHPGAAVGLIETLCQRLRQTTEFLEDAVLVDVPLRVLRRLEALAEQRGRTEGDGVYIGHGLTQQEFAQFVGVSRVSVNKTMTSWRSARLIEYGRGFVRIVDQNRLRRAVRGRC